MLAHNWRLSDSLGVVTSTFSIHTRSRITSTNASRSYIVDPLVGMDALNILSIFIAFPVGPILCLAYLLSLRVHFFAFSAPTHVFLFEYFSTTLLGHAVVTLDSFGRGVFWSTSFSPLL